jgi:hypothetical protein
MIVGLIGFKFDVIDVLFLFVENINSVKIDFFFFFWSLCCESFDRVWSDQPDKIKYAVSPYYFIARRVKMV